MVLAAVWKQVPYNVLFFLAGLQAIPPSLLEAAAIDGVKSADLGGSSAQSVVLMAIVVVLTVLQFRFVERKVSY